MLLEGSAWRGLDNLFIPIGGYFLLHAYVPMDVAMLASRLLDRERKEFTLGRFDVTVISRYFPEFERELPRYLSPP